jgi:hypothetical protein
MKTITKIILAVMLLGTFSIAHADEKNYRKDHPKWGMKDPITKAEYLKWHEEMFNKIDTNKDGVLSSEERKAFRETMKEKKEEKSKR